MTQKNLSNLRTELNDCDNKGLNEVSIHILRAAVNELDRVSQLQMTQEIALKELVQIENELIILRTQSLRIQAERDSVVELHKQVVLALRDADKQKTQGE